MSGPAKRRVFWLPCANSGSPDVYMCVCVFAYMCEHVHLGSTREIHLLAKDESNITNLKDFLSLSLFFLLCFMLEYS